MAASVTITLGRICGGGEHLRLDVTGDAAATVPMDVSELSAAITQAEREAFCKVICKMVKKDKTMAQARTQLQAGVTITVL